MKRPKGGLLAIRWDYDYHRAKYKGKDVEEDPKAAFHYGVCDGLVMAGYAFGWDLERDTAREAR